MQNLPCSNGTRLRRVHQALDTSVGKPTPRSISADGLIRCARHQNRTSQSRRERGDPVISRCANPKDAANPNCSNRFRYLHEGKLCLVDSSAAKAKRNGSSRRAGESRPPEYAWLCASCCRHMSIRFDEELGAMVVRDSEPLQEDKFGRHS
jgi:hypothetical protein